jgi:hypothetical protein
VSKTIEDKLVEKQNKKEISEVLPSYNKRSTLLAGGFNLICKLIGHKTRWVYHQFHTVQTDQGKEYYECWICSRCKDVEGKLVRVQK